MSLGGNLSSGYTDNLIDKATQCAVTKASAIAYSDNCCVSGNSTQQPVARYPSMVLQAKSCPSSTPAEFAKYPKIATSSSVRTQALTTTYNSSAISPLFATLPLPQDRFAKYNRFKAPVECPPVIQLSAALLSNSVPASLNTCNRF